MEQSTSQHVVKHVVFVTWKTGNAAAFAAAKRLGHDVTLVRSLRMEHAQHADFDASPYRDQVDQVLVLADHTDEEALTACLTELHRRHPIDGFIASTDALVVPVARVAERLGVPFTSSAAAATAKQKHLCRDALAAAGVEHTGHEVVAGLDGARAFAARTGYPIVLKPACASASEGAHVVPDEAALRAVFDRVAADPATYAAGVLVEEYLTGTFLSAEIALVRGEVLRLCVSERATWAEHEPLEIGTTIPAAITPEAYGTVMSFAERVIRAVGLDLGVFHVEVMLGHDGVPRLIELNPRVMGSCLPNLFCLASGVDFFELLIRIYLDEPVELTGLEFTRYATVRWFGAAEPEPTPAAVPDLGWAEEYRPALHSLTVRFPDTPVLPACRGNLDGFGEVQVVHPEYASSVRITQEIVDRVASQLGMKVTR